MINTTNRKNEFDIIVVGSGIAGLYAAYKASEFARVCLLTKGKIHETNTWLAQGGVAAALGEDDTPDDHLHDTLAAGAGACVPEAVAILVKEGPMRIKELLSLGTPFDRTEGHLSLTREGAHHKNRILHCGGDATGRVLQQTLQEKLMARHSVIIYENTFAVDLIVHESRVCGVQTLAEPFFAPAVILAAGGLGQVYARTTNPAAATGDGIAMAYRAGADVVDMEFVQFHPTAFHGQSEEDTFLISEAVRGEGGLLRDNHGRRFMGDYHPMADLGPRDIVARAIVEQMKRQNGEPVWLDITHHDAGFLQERFPTIYQESKRRGYDMAVDWLPVSPAAHYAMGGIACGLNGQTSIPGLYACGEAACSGVHGANRLASNSLLEGLVFACRVVQAIQSKKVSPYTKSLQSATQKNAAPFSDCQPVRSYIRQRMFMEAGVLRSKNGLYELAGELADLMNQVGRPSRQEEWELMNILTSARLIVRGALWRKESRGAHYRKDYPQSDPALAGCRYKQNRKDGNKHAFIAV